MTCVTSRPPFAVLGRLAGLAFALLVPAGGLLGGDRSVHVDEIGDSTFRRTDPGADGPIAPQQGQPDLVQVVIGGWTSPTPGSNPYAGRWIDSRDTNLFRIDLVFAGIVNPPGPVNLLGEGYDPFRHGPTPLFGWLELDIDEDKDTGGEIDGVRDRPLGNASRFGGRFDGSIGGRAAVTADDFDGDLCTGPEVERSGEEFHLGFCGCEPLAMTPLGDPTPLTFDSGDTWLVTGRVFRRALAFADFSFAFGGSAPGQYDPVVTLRFDHDPGADRTTVSLVWALDNSGAADLRGESDVEPLDLDVANQTSLLEGLQDIRLAATNGNGSPCAAWGLLAEWGDDNHDELDDFLRADQWDVLGLFGTVYAEEQTDATWVWTDAGPEHRTGDLDGDGIVNAADVNVLIAAVAAVDGTPVDADGLAGNGQVGLAAFGTNFALHDLDYDGRINALDLAPLGAFVPGDVDADGDRDQADLVALGTMAGLGADDAGFNPVADLNGDGTIGRFDASILERLLRIGAIPYAR